MFLLVKTAEVAGVREPSMVGLEIRMMLEMLFKSRQATHCMGKKNFENSKIVVEAEVQSDREGVYLEKRWCWKGIQRL